ncbi:MAG: amino acid ABC transporter substrate-binding protein [Deltaproteobacteria bacterium]|nr:amino acid ABC transporter substrate-binding protein [Deltaproteobacteria bacterium]
MKKHKLAVMFLIVLFASPLSARELTGTLKQIKETARIRIGYRPSEPPMSFLDKEGKPAGYSIDLGKFVVEEIERKIGSKIKVVYVPVNAKNRFKALTQNKIDILCGSTTKTLSRSELVDFTLLTFVTGASLMTLREDRATQAQGFSGKTIGVVKGTTTEIALRKLIEETSTDTKILLFNSTKEGIDALRRKKIHAFSADQVVLIGIALKTGTDVDFLIDGNVFSYEPFAFAVRRNDADFRLVADRAISRLCRTKKILEIYDRWIGSYVGRGPGLFSAMIELNAIPE